MTQFRDKIGTHTPEKNISIRNPNIFLQKYYQPKN